MSDEPGLTSGFRPKLIEALRDYERAKFFADLGAGLTVGIPLEKHSPDRVGAVHNFSEFYGMLLDRLVSL